MAEQGTANETRLGHAEAIARAVELHRRGRLDEAERLYRAILAALPQDFDAQHLLGVLRHQQGRHDEAIARISAALEARPASAEAHSNLGLALHAANRSAEALPVLERALALRSDYVEAWSNRGLALHALGRHADAIASFERALALRPDYAEALSGRAIALRALGRLDDALASLERAVALRPEHAGAWCNRGNVLHALGRAGEALASYERALALRPQHAEALYNRGKVLRALGRSADALQSYERALAVVPDFVQALNEHGVALCELGLHARALASFERALAIEPRFGPLLNNLGNALHALGRHAEAIAVYDRALALEELPETCDNRGIALQRLDRLEDALESHERALALRPDYPEALCNRATALHRLGRVADAIDGFARAQAARPDYAEAHWYEGIARLTAGDFAGGWPKHEWRWAAPAFTSPRRGFEQPVWRGEAPAGRTILLHAEQGLGDTLQFVRYAPLVAARGARVWLEVQEPLVSLLAGVPGVERVFARDAVLPRFDLHCPLLSLPFVFRTTQADVPPPISGLRESAERRAEWTRRLERERGRAGARPELRVGLAWSGLADHREDRNRSIPLAALGTLLALAERNPDANAQIRLVSLQKDLRNADRAVLEAGAPLLRFGEELGDFADTAALVSRMDVVVSVDTSIAHLAGSLGKPLFVLLPFAPDWRWMLERADTPWYPSARLFRQARRGDWEPVLRRVADALLELANGKPVPPSG